MAAKFSLYGLNTNGHVLVASSMLNAFGVGVLLAYAAQTPFLSTLRVYRCAALALARLRSQPIATWLVSLKYLIA